MSAPTARPGDSPAPPANAVVPEVASGGVERRRRRTRRWIHDWDPEDPIAWHDGGRRVARRNLLISILAEFTGFCVWAIWSVLVPQLPAAGFTLTTDQMFWLIGTPALVGAVLRIPYTLAVGAFGGRNWTVFSAALLLVPIAGLALVVREPGTPFGVLLAVAALAGFGGGNFASSMANISYFYPAARKGGALGWNAAGGNIGTAAVQLVVPLVVLAGAGVALERAAYVLVPLILVSVVLAWRFMDNLGGVSADPRRFLAALGSGHTWLISFLYIGTFGSFVGFAGVFPILLTSRFPDVPVSLAFLGALAGSLARPLGGVLGDRFGGARVSLACYGGLVLGTLGVLAGMSSQGGEAVRGPAMFLGSFVLLFTAAGVGNGAVYRMIPVVFRVSGGSAEMAAGCIGIAGAVGALGGFLVPRAFAMSTALSDSLVPALWVFLGTYVVMALLAAAVYGRGAMRAAAV